MSQAPLSVFKQYENSLKPVRYNLQDYTAEAQASAGDSPYDQWLRSQNRRLSGFNLPVYASKYNQVLAQPQVQAQPGTTTYTSERPAVQYTPPTGYTPPTPPSTGYAPPSTGYAPPSTGYAPPSTGYAPPSSLRDLTPSSSYADYYARATDPNMSLTDRWLQGSSAPLTESEWNTQKARSASDAARGVTFGGGSAPVEPVGYTPLPTGYTSAEPTGYQPKPTPDYQPAVSDLTPSSSYADYYARATDPNMPLTNRWLQGSSAPLTESEWNTQKARSASDAARGVTFGGGSAPVEPAYQQVVGSFISPSTGNVVTYDANGVHTDTGHAPLAQGDGSMPTGPTEPAYQQVVGSFISPSTGNVVTYDSNGVHTDTGHAPLAHGGLVKAYARGGLASMATTYGI